MTLRRRPSEEDIVRRPSEEDHAKRTVWRRPSEEDLEKKTLRRWPMRRRPSEKDLAKKTVWRRPCEEDFAKKAVRRRPCEDLAKKTLQKIPCEEERMKKTLRRRPSEEDLAKKIRSKAPEQTRKLNLSWDLVEMYPRKNWNEEYENVSEKVLRSWQEEKVFEPFEELILDLWKWTFFCKIDDMFRPTAPQLWKNDITCTHWRVYWHANYLFRGVITGQIQSITQWGLRTTCHGIIATPPYPKPTTYWWIPRHCTLSQDWFTPGGGNNRRFEYRDGYRVGGGSLWASTTCSISHILSHLRGHISSGPQPNYSTTHLSAVKRCTAGGRKGSRTEAGAVAMATVTQQISKDGER